MPCATEARERGEQIIIFFVLLCLCPSSYSFGRFNFSCCLFQFFFCLFAGFCVSSEIVLEMAIHLPMVDYLQKIK